MTHPKLSFLPPSRRPPHARVRASETVTPCGRSRSFWTVSRRRSRGVSGERSRRQVRSSVEAQVSDEGVAVVPGRLLHEIVRSLPDAEVTIEHHPEEAIVVVTAGPANYRLHTYSAEDFPRLPDVDTAQFHAVDRDVLIETVGRVGRSASRDESRPVLTGILVRFEPGKVVMAATDSCVAGHALPPPGIESRSALLPSAPMTAVSRP